MKAFLITLSFLLSQSVLAQFESYDQIVSDLSNFNSTKTSRKKIKKRRSYNSYPKAHLGIGMGRSFYDSGNELSPSGVEEQGGLVINLGIDLLSREFGIEGSFANFGTSDNENGQQDLREFTLQGIFRPVLTSTWAVKLGLGLSSRFLDISSQGTQQSFRTPSGLFLFGVDRYLSDMVSVGADLSFKSAMISDTVDKSSANLSLRFDTHF